MPGKEDQAEATKAFESKLIPALRQGVDVIKMIFFKELKKRVGETYSGFSEREGGMLCGAVINNLFGTPNREETLSAFVEANDAIIRKELALLPETLGSLRIPLTDALRIQFLCDDLEGIDGSNMLERAADLGVLVVDRQVPLPRTFMELARRLGEAHHILQPQK